MFTNENIIIYDTNTKNAMVYQLNVSYSAFSLLKKSLHFSYNQRCWAFFHVFVGHLYIFFGEMSIQVFCPLFNWVVGYFLLLSWMSCLYILEIKPLSVASFETIFSHSVGCLFFFMVSFTVQMLISLIRSHWFIFAFISFALGDWPEKTFEGWCQRMFSYVLF